MVTRPFLFAEARMKRNDRWFENQLSNTTVFSGADIEVIAYRNYSDIFDPEIDQKKREIKNLRLEEELGQEDIEARIARNNAALDRGSVIDDDLSKEIDDHLTKLKPKSPQINIDGKAPNAPATKPIVSSVSLSQARNKLQDIKDKIKIAETELLELTEFKFFKLGSLHTLSYSSFREKFAVRTIGRVQAKGYTQGPRTIAGTLVFNQLQEHELFKISREEKKDTPGSTHPRAYMLDQIKPFNLMLFFTNEFGVYSAMHLFDVTIASEGQEMSIDQIITQNAMNFYATEMVPMTSYGNQFESESQMLAKIIRKVNKENGEASKNNNAPKPPDQLIATTSDGKREQEELEKMLQGTRNLF